MPFTGLQYDGDIWRANKVLGNLTGYYPSTPAMPCYEVAGFFWWQGDKDSRDLGFSAQYAILSVTRLLASYTTLTFRCLRCSKYRCKHHIEYIAKGGPCSVYGAEITDLVI